MCDGSICREICDPTAQITCDDGRCINLSERTGQSAGYCAEPGCDFFTGMAVRMVKYVDSILTQIRASLGVVVSALWRL